MMSTKQHPLKQGRIHHVLAACQRAPLAICTLLLPYIEYAPRCEPFPAPRTNKRGRPVGAPLGNQQLTTKNQEQFDLYAFAAFTPLNAKARRDLYRFPVFSCNTPLLMATSIADSVGCSKVPAAPASPALIAVRSRLINVRTRVRLARFTSAR